MEAALVGNRVGARRLAVKASLAPRRVREPLTILALCSGVLPRLWRPTPNALTARNRIAIAITWTRLARTALIVRVPRAVNAPVPCPLLRGPVFLATLARRRAQLALVGERERHTRRAPNSGLHALPAGVALRLPERVLVLALRAFHAHRGLEGELFIKVLRGPKAFLNLTPLIVQW